VYSCSRRVAEILDKEEKLLSQSKAGKSVYKNIVVNADEELSHLVRHMEDHPELASSYWHEELINSIDSKELKKHCIYEAEAEKLEHGEYCLYLFVEGTSREDGFEFDNYIDAETVGEDLMALVANGYTIHINTNLKEI
jgi:hypothetical protein